MITSGAENVYSIEVERVLSPHPDVAALAVIGVPDERWGEQIHAIVVPTGTAEPDENDLIEHCRAEPATYRCPRSVEYRDSPLLSAAGKVLNNERNFREGDCVVSGASPSARDVVVRYLDVLYNERRLDLIPELIADPTWRHKAGQVSCLTAAETVERLRATLDLCPELHFDTVVMHDDGTMVTVNWNGTSAQRDGRSYEYCGIEVFRVLDGKIVEIWNSRETGGHWQPSRSF